MSTIFLVVLLYCFTLAVNGDVFYTEQNRIAIAGDAENLVEEPEGGSCSCDKKSLVCKCCVNVHIPENGKDFTVCVELKYVPEEVGVAVVVTLDGVVIFVKTVSARDPPPFCFGVPHFKKEASVCLQLYDLAFSPSKFSGCARVLIRLAHMYTKKFNLGCFKMPLDEINEIENKH